MRDQRTFGHTSGVGVVDPLDVESGQRLLDTVGNRQVRNEAPAVDPYKIPRQCHYVRLGVVHAIPVFLGSQAASKQWACLAIFAHRVTNMETRS